MWSEEIDWKSIDIKGLATLVGSCFEKYEVDVILVGGACVSIYSKNKYVSGDLDLITYQEGKKIKKILKEIGFEYDDKKYFTHPECPFYLEFVNPPIAIGREPVSVFSNVTTDLGKIKLLTPTDCVKDRLAAYFHWNDLQSLDQSVMVARENEVDFDDIKKWSKKEGMLDKFNTFISKLDNYL